VERNRLRARDKAIGTSYVLDVQPFVPDGVGSAEAPLEVSCSEAFDTRVGVLSSSYYEVIDVVPGVQYLVEARDFESREGALAVAPGDGDIQVEPCATIDNDGVLRCVFASSTTSMLVRVSSGVASDFTLSLHALPSGSEGFASAPVPLELAELPYDATVASAAAGYYAISGLADIDYILRVTSTDELVDYDVFADAELSELLTSSQSSPGMAGESAFHPTDDTIYVRVTLPPERDGITAFSVELDTF